MMYSKDVWFSYNLILYARTFSMSRSPTRLRDQNWLECKLQKIAGNIIETFKFESENFLVGRKTFPGVGHHLTHPWKWIFRGEPSPNPPLKIDFQGRVTPTPVHF